ncbi:ester cyclase [Solirubrobacter phytolaccae]|uniref:Ester cyclase n=1 Tax=Solirubrobacter phytolaccae TaxID=1404360 RepID=A0A9X3N9Y0_9ACTN|nr:ester cyclase [Solirubrobacter phytolaccae]MDA0182740.1 ester cyclase [Solirubrobacter phytolaccae]
MTSPLTSSPTDIALANFELITAESVTLADAERVVSPDHVNHEAHNEPLECRARGPRGLLATRAWLRAAFSRFEIEPLDVVTDGELVAFRCAVTVHHTGDFAFFDPAGRVKDAFPPTGREATIFQSHWFTIRDGLALEHRAVRDDLGMAVQLGWVPPKPPYLVGMALAKRRTQRAVDRGTAPWQA